MKLAVTKPVEDISDTTWNMEVRTPTSMLLNSLSHMKTVRTAVAARMMPRNRRNSEFRKYRLGSLVVMAWK